MNKRTFLRLFSAMAAWPVVSPLLAWAAGGKLKNWAGNLEYGTDRLYSANSLEQVRTFVKGQGKLKVLGSRHCFNTIADSTQTFLSLKAMDKVVACGDFKVFVGAGRNNSTYSVVAPAGACK